MARVSSRLVALSTAAVVTVYTAGFLRTKAAADRFADEDGPRRGSGPAREPVAVAQPRTLPAADTAPLAIAVAVPAPAAPKVAAPPMVTPKDAAPAAPKAVVDEKPQPAAPVEPVASDPRTSEVKTAETKVAAPAPEPPPPPAPTWKDGTYYGWGTSRHGDIQAGLVIESGKIMTVSITQCLTRYSCSIIAHLLPQVISRQSADVDYVSGATQSTNAFYYAVLEALNKAK